MRALAILGFLLVLVASGAALAGRGDPQEQFTAADQARAKSMSLRQTDFNAAFTARPSSTGNGGFYCAALDESDLTVTGKAESSIFTATTEFVSSNASIYESRADANASWKRGTSSAGEQCLRDEIRRELRGTALRFLSFRRVPFPARGDRSVAFRAIASQQGVRLYVDVVAMQVARAQAAVLYTSLLAPAPEGELRRLTGVVERRAEKTMRGA